MRQEQEKERKEEEARKLKAEQERLEKERKEKKKQKEKERIARLKKEGKYETKEQKEAKQRALLQLGAMGVRIPLKTTETNAQTPDAEAEQEAARADAEKTAQRKPKFERLRKKQTQQTDTQEQADEKNENEENEGKTNEEGEEDNVKDAWDAEDVKEEWDAEIDTSEKTKSTSAPKKSKESAKTTKPSEAEKADKQESDEEESEEESESEVSESESESDDDDDRDLRDLPPMERAKVRIQRRHDEAEKNRTVDNLRAPVICVLGHVDTGKTKILDNLRRTRVQEDEAGGITQQIGATNVPLETIQERTKMCRHIYKNSLRIPGLLIIDTPGHESFKSLRSRGSSLCDIAILVIDIMHGLEPQTIEFINILKEKKTPFLVALNKIDRLFDWKSSPQQDVIKVLESQPENTMREFETRTNEVIVQLAEQGLNAALFFKNPDVKSYISLVPTSAHTSDGIGNLMALIIEFSQTIRANRVSYSTD